jgi:hypothetical protein
MTANAGEMNFNRLVGVIAATLGVALLLGGGLWTSHHRRFMHDALTAPGQVIDYAETQSTSTSGTSPAATTTVHRSYCAVVRFTDRDGRVTTYRDNVCSSPPSFRLGQTVTVYYDPHNSSDALVDHGLIVYALPVACAVFGLVCLLAGLQRLAGRGIAAPPGLVIGGQ